MTFDGLVLHGPMRDDGTIRSYSHFYRTGIFEAATTSLLETSETFGQRLILHISFEGHVLRYLALCFRSLERLGVRPRDQGHQPLRTGSLPAVSDPSSFGRARTILPLVSVHPRSSQC